MEKKGRTYIIKDVKIYPKTLKAMGILSTILTNMVKIKEQNYTIKIVKVMETHKRILLKDMVS